MRDDIEGAYNELAAGLRTRRDIEIAAVHERYARDYARLVLARRHSDWAALRTMDDRFGQRLSRLLQAVTRDRSDAPAKSG